MSDLIKFEDYVKKFLNSLWIRLIFTIIPLNSSEFPKIGKFGIISDAIPREIDDLTVSSRQRGDCPLQIIGAHSQGQFPKAYELLNWDFLGESTKRKRITTCTLYVLVKENAKGGGGVGFTYIGSEARMSTCTSIIFFHSRYTGHMYHTSMLTRPNEGLRDT